MIKFLELFLHIIDTLKFIWNSCFLLHKIEGAGVKVCRNLILILFSFDWFPQYFDTYDDVYTSG